MTDRHGPSDLLLDSISVRQGSFSLDIRDLSFPSGKLVLVVGPNGSGKTTLCESILGIRFAERRRLLFGDSPIEEIRPLSAFVPTSLTFFGTVKGRRLASLVAAVSENWDWRRFETLTERWLLKTNRVLGSLSTGERRRFFLAIALARTPRLVILDEPFTNLDPSMTLDLAEVIREYIDRTRCAALITTNVLSPVLGICDRIAFLKEGECVREVEAAGPSMDGIDLWQEVYG